MPRWIVPAWCGVAVIFAASVASTHAATLASATFDTDSYLFVGTNNEFDPGISIAEDISGGVAESNNSHFIFGVVKFDELNGLTTKAAGGGDKYLKLSVSRFPGEAQIGISAAAADYQSDTNGYPSAFLTGNPRGNEVDRLNWYHANIKGNNSAFGGYAGGASHLGDLTVSGLGDYFLDVTSTVDAWIDGSLPNYGFGLWGARVPGGLGNTFDFYSANDGSGQGPQLVNVVPEPHCLVSLATGFLMLASRSRLRSRQCDRNLI